MTIEELNRLWEQVEPRLHPENSLETMTWESGVAGREIKPAAAQKPAPPLEQENFPRGSIETSKSPEALLHEETALLALYVRLCRLCPVRSLRRPGYALLSSQDSWHKKLAAALFLQYGTLPAGISAPDTDFPRILQDCYERESTLLAAYTSFGAQSALSRSLGEMGRSAKERHGQILSELTERWLAER